MGFLRALLSGDKASLKLALVTSLGIGVTIMCFQVRTQSRAQQIMLEVC